MRTFRRNGTQFVGIECMQSFVVVVDDMISKSGTVKFMRVQVSWSFSGIGATFGLFAVAFVSIAVAGVSRIL